MSGLIALVTKRARRFREIKVERIAAVAAQTSTALTNARLLDETRRWNEHLRGIEALSRELMIAVDRYVALRWPLAGDAGVSVPDALAVLREEAGSRLPPDAVAALEQVEADGELP